MENRLEVQDHVFKEEGPVVIAHNAADNVVATTRVWTFINALFNRAFVGKILRIAAAVNPGNNGDFVIQEVLSATSVRTIQKGILTNEVFGVAVTQEVEFDPCWHVNSLVTGITINFADGTTLDASPAADAAALFEGIKGLIKEAESRGSRTGGAYKWEFTVKGADCKQVDCETGNGA